MSNVFCQIDVISNNIYQKDKKIGIGTQTPTSWLSVTNDTSTIGYAENTSIVDFRRIYEGSTSKFQIYGYPKTSELPDYLQESIMLYSTDDAKNFKICAAPRGGNIQFLTDGWINPESERMRIDSKGNIGIGTSQPKSKLHIADGDIFISDIEKGIIMKSPDGGCWRGTLDDSGVLSFVSIDCPDASVITNIVNIDSRTSSILVYPNPSKDILTVDLSGLSLNKIKYQIRDIKGKKVDSGRIDTNDAFINISHLRKGFYFLEIIEKNGNRLNVQKIIKE